MSKDIYCKDKQSRKVEGALFVLVEAKLFMYRNSWSQAPDWLQFFHYYELSSYHNKFMKLFERNFNLLGWKEQWGAGKSALGQVFVSYTKDHFPSSMEKSKKK